MAAGFSLVAGEGSLMPSVGATGGGRSFAPVGDAPPDRGQWSLLSALPRPEVATLSELFIGGARNGGARDGGEQIRKQLQKAQIKIVFDPATESVTLMTLHDWKKIQR